MVYAEKIITALQRGTNNNRWRHFTDLYLLTGRHPWRGQSCRVLSQQGGTVSLIRKPSACT